MYIYRIPSSLRSNPPLHFFQLEGSLLSPRILRLNDFATRHNIADNVQYDPESLAFGAQLTEIWPLDSSMASLGQCIYIRDVQTHDDFNVPLSTNDLLINVSTQRHT